MADRSAIEWTEATWNPTTGCDRISAGCDNCYALALSKRLKAMGSAKYQADGDPRTSGPGFGVALHEDVLDVPRRWREPRVVFVNSMSDLFHARVPLVYVQRVFEVMRETPRHTYQLLTKRAVRLARLAPQLDWPANVWMGVSVENMTEIARIDELRIVPAAVRFVSAEPLLGPLHDVNLSGIHWLIAGGESGRNSRPMNPDWVRDLREQCHASSTAFFFKLLCTIAGANPPASCSRRRVDLPAPPPADPRGVPLLLAVVLDQFQQKPGGRSARTPEGDQDLKPLPVPVVVVVRRSSHALHVLSAVDFLDAEVGEHRSQVVGGDGDFTVLDANDLAHRALDGLGNATSGKPLHLAGNAQRRRDRVTCYGRRVTGHASSVTQPATHQVGMWQVATSQTAAEVQA